MLLRIFENGDEVLFLARLAFEEFENHLECIRSVLYVKRIISVMSKMAASINSNNRTLHISTGNFSLGHFDDWFHLIGEISSVEERERERFLCPAYYDDDLFPSISNYLPENFDFSRDD